MKKYTFYLYKGFTYYEDTKKLSFVKVSDPSVVISYVSMDPDEVDKFREISPSLNAKAYRSIPEKIYRNLTNMSAVCYLTEYTFENLMKKLNKYMKEIEDYERMCVLRDVTEFYKNQTANKKAEIQDYIKHFNKTKKNL